MSDAKISKLTDQIIGVAKNVAHIGQIGNITNSHVVVGEHSERTSQQEMRNESTSTATAATTTVETKPPQDVSVAPRSFIAASVYFLGVFLTFAAYSVLFRTEGLDSWDWVQVALSTVALRGLFYVSSASIWKGQRASIWSVVALAVSVLGFIQGATTFADQSLIHYIAAWMIWNF